MFYEKKGLHCDKMFHCRIRIWFGDDFGKLHTENIFNDGKTFTLISAKKKNYQSLEMVLLIISNSEEQKKKKKEKRNYQFS